MNDRKDIWEKILDLRNEMIDYITERVKAKGGRVSYAECNDVPALNSANNEEDIFVLDEITLDGDTLRFSGSSSWQSDWWNENQIGTDELHEIYITIDDAVESMEDDEDEYEYED